MEISPAATWIGLACPLDLVLLLVVLATLALVQKLLDGVEAHGRILGHASQVLGVEVLLEGPAGTVLCPLLHVKEKNKTGLEHQLANTCVRAHQFDLTTVFRISIRLLAHSDSQ
jgi:hypothetical protein